MKHLIFVYGSLKRGHFNCARGLGRSKFICEAETKPEYTLYDLGPYPAMAHHGTTSVKGEIWECAECDFRFLSRMERGAGYDEEQVELTEDTQLRTAKPILCWVQNNLDARNYGDVGREWPLPKRRELSPS